MLSPLRLAPQAPQCLCKPGCRKVAYIGLHLALQFEVKKDLQLKGATKDKKKGKDSEMEEDEDSS